jgi:hypothetical protein
MTENRGKWITYKRNEDAAGLTAGERDRSLQYHSPETTSGLEEVENTGINLAQGNPDGDKKETSKEKSAIEYEDIKNFLEYIIKKQNETLTNHENSIKEQNKTLTDRITSMEEHLRGEMKAERKDLREEIKHDRKALQDSMEIHMAKLQHDLRTKIEMSSKSSKLESERLLRELLESLHSETSKYNDLISQVKKVTEDKLIRVNSKIIEVSEELENKLE